LPVTHLASLLTTVRVRLTLLYVVILALILAIFSGAVYVTEQNYLVSQLDSELHTHLEELGST
jgi:hypothetical protein